MEIRGKELGPEHPDVAQSLYVLASIYFRQGEYAEAESLYQHALAIKEKTLGPEHPDVARSLNNLAFIYYDKGDYVKAEQFHQRALAIREKTLGPEHPEVFQSLNNLANVCFGKGDYAKAETLCQRVLSNREKTLGPDHLDVAGPLDNLAIVYFGKGDYAKAEPLHQRALMIREQKLGPEHLNVARTLHNLAQLYRGKGDYAKAEPLYQRALNIREKVLGKAGCISCHHNSLPAMAVVAARKGGFAVDDQELRDQVKTIARYLEGWRERALQGIGVPGESDTVSYILLGLAAQNYQPDAITDAMARYLKTKQMPEGRWWIFSHRPPIQSSDIQVTAASMRALQIYGPKARRREYEKAVQAAAAWLAKAKPKTTEERAFQLMGMGWAGEDKEAIRKAGRSLIDEQRPDGGWAQLPTLASDAYATGQALVALRESGALPVADTAYQRGIHFLLNTQLEDGSWHVKSRAIPIQPYFESDFPHGHDQWISAAATSWATMALAPAAEKPAKRSKVRRQYVKGSGYIMTPSRS